MTTKHLWTLADGGAMPRLGQGTWYLGETPSKRKDELAALRTGIEEGLSLIDTAEMYGEGKSESLVGEVIAPYDREKLFIVSKVYPWNAGRKKIAKSCEGSLKRLGTDYLDLYLLHWMGNVPLAEVVEGMENLANRGLIRRWGVSNLDLEDMEELWSVPNGHHCQTDQVLYHLASRGVETVLQPWLKEHHQALMAYCPLAQGASLRRRLLTNPKLKKLADEKGCTVFQLMLAFLLAQENVIPIPRTGSAVHAKENAAAMDIILTHEDLTILNRICPAPRQRESLDIM